ncbi:MAG: histidine phosphatase family protein [Proteobacteria bacterium]|nr:histidine phosphatase family protein [Pseudomonadota bacterium]
MLNLMVMRHAKSDWDAGSPDDHGRPLSRRGIASAERMGEVLRDLEIAPELVISSTAKRARATAELARVTGGWSARLILSDELYGASVGDTLTVLGQLADTHSRVMVVGHQPTWSMLVQHLTGARCAMRTATIADIELASRDWSGVGGASGTLTTLLQPRTFMRA